MADEKTIGFKIEIQGTESEIDKLGKVKASINQVEDELRKLTNASKTNSETFEKNASAIVDLETQLKSLRSEYRQQQESILKGAKANDLATGSYNELSAQLYIVAARQKELSAAERADVAIGGELQKQRLDLTNQLKEIDAQNGVYVRNVGNYSSTMTGYANTLRGLRGPTKLLGEALGIGAQEADQFRIVIEHSLQAIASFTKGTQENTAKIVEQTAATEAQTVADEAGAVAKIGLLGWIALGTTAVIAAGIAIYEYATKTYFSIEAAKEFDKAIQEVTKDNEKNIDSIKKLMIEYDVLNGVITKFEGDRRKITLDSTTERTKAEEKYQENYKKIVEAQLKADEGFSIRKLQIFGADAKRQADIFKQLLSEENSLKIAHDAQLLNIETKTKAEIAKINEEEKVEKTKKDKKDLDDLKKKNDEILKANLALLKEIELQQNQLIPNAEAREIDKQRIIDKYARIELQTSKAYAATKAKELEMLDLINKDNLRKIQEKYDEEHLKNREQVQKQLDKLDEQSDKDAVSARKALLKTLEKLEKDKEKAEIEKKKQIIQAVNAAENAAKQTDQAIFQEKQDQNKRELDTTITHLKDLHDAESQSLQARLASGQILQAQFDAEKIISDKKFEDAQLAAKKLAFEKDKELKKEQILVELALASFKILARELVSKGPGGFISAAIEEGALISSAVIQTAAIDKQQFSSGGIVFGSGTQTSDSVPASLSVDESVINARSTRMFKPLLSAINEAGGGKSFYNGISPSITLPSSANSFAQQLDMDAFARTIIKGINDKRVIQSEKDVRNVLNKVQQIESDSTF